MDRVSPAAPPLAASSLQLVDLQCIRARRALFSGLTLAVPAGHVLRVQGPNGAGKTSLLRMICGLLSPHAGEVLWKGRNIAKLREEFGRELTFFGHLAGLKAELSPLENLLITAALSDIACDPPTALKALAAAGLSGHERMPVRALSQGQRRRAALARLMLSPTPLWVLDEPFNALDQAATQWLLTLIGAHANRGGIIVLTSHQPVALEGGICQITLTL